MQYLECTSTSGRVTTQTRTTALYYTSNLYLKQCTLHLLFCMMIKYRWEHAETQNSDTHRRLLKTKETCELLLKALNTESFTESPAPTFTKWTKASLNRVQLGKFYVIWKLQKQANSRDVMSYPISNNTSIGYPTGQSPLVSFIVHG